MVKSVGQSGKRGTFEGVCKAEKNSLSCFKSAFGMVKKLPNSPFELASLDPQATFPAIAGECVVRGCGGVNQLIRFVFLQIIAILGNVLSMVFNTQKHKWFTCYDVVV